MRQHRKWLMAILVISGFIFLGRTAGAYSLSSPQPPDTTLFAPFRNFIDSINSVGTNAVRIVTPPAAPNGGSQGGFLTTGFRSAFGRFDGWLYGIAGFHISNFFTAILNIFSWVLGIMKGAVDWLLALVH